MHLFTKVILGVAIIAALSVGIGQQAINPIPPNVTRAVQEIKDILQTQAPEGRTVECSKPSAWLIRPHDSGNVDGQLLLSFLIRTFQSLRWEVLSDPQALQYSWVVAADPDPNNPYILALGGILLEDATVFIVKCEAKDGRGA